MLKVRYNKGFTLLEILLVIAAIGILAAIVLVAINPNRQLAQVRNAERRSEINTLYKAIEQYLIETRSYPAGITTSIQDICINGNTTNCVNLGVLVPDYIASIPIDPQGVAYKVSINGANNRVSVYASNAELGQVIGLNNAWTPARISTALWLDAADSSTITLNGSTVSQWNDKSGNAVNFTQATAANQPLYVTNQQNGLSVVRNVTADFMTAGENSIGRNQSVVTMFAVAKNPTATPTSLSTLLFVSNGLSQTTTRVGLFQSNNTTAFLSVAGRRLDNDGFVTVPTNTSYASTQNQWVIQEGEFNFTTAQVNAWLNGTVTANAVAFQTAGSTSDTNSLRASFFATSEGSNNSSNNTEIAEALIVHGTLSTSNRQRIEGYLAWKWGLVHNLPVNHPYRWDGREFGYTSSGITDSDAQTYIAGVETADGQVLESGTRTAIQNFIIGAKADGIWNAIKSSNILAGARTLNGALVPLKGTAPTNFNFVSGDYNRKTGLIGDGSTKYLEINRNNNADPQNNNHNAVFITTASNIAGVSAYMATSAGHAGSNNLAVNTTLNEVFCRSRSASASAISNAARIGFAGFTRSVSAQYDFRISGNTTTNSIVSDVPVADPISLFRRGTSNYSNGRLSFYSIGESLNLALLDARVTQLMTNLGNAIP